MKAELQNELLRILTEATRGVSAAALANMLGVSQRTIRNYVKKLNEEGRVAILASRDGYVLAHNDSNPDDTLSESDMRVWKVLSDLLANRSGVNAFDAAERLYVSASTVINTIIPQIREMIKGYGLRVESHKYQFVLKGSEQDKRRFIGHIATEDSYGFFNSKNALEQLFPQQDIHGMMQRLYGICQKADLFLNDFAFNNLLIHLLIILIRLRSEDDLEEKEIVSPAGEANIGNNPKIVALADLISTDFTQFYGISIPEADYQQILILIALSVEHETVDIEGVVTREFTERVASMLASVSQHYCTPVFSDSFIIQFSLHMYYTRQRCAFHLGYPNPIGPQFKRDYAPVYDMAVFFAHSFSQEYHIDFSEDELAFIAFHFGSYLENNKQQSQRVTAVILTENYYMASKELMSAIDTHFSQQILITDVMPCNRYMQHPPKCDLVITTLPLPLEVRHVVQVNPILTRQNIDSLRSVLDAINDEKELGSDRAFLRSLFHRELYFRNIKKKSEAEYIRFLGQRCIECGYAKEEFLQDVLLRESLSSTAFTDTLAVPHAVKQYAERSFMAVVHNDTPILWSKKRIHFILMIGITAQDMKYFKGAFDLIIELFNSTDRTLKLLKTNTFEEFLEQMS